MAQLVEKYKLQVTLDNGQSIDAGEIVGVVGEQGPVGPTPNLTIQATVDNFTGTPKCTVSKWGTNEDPVFKFAFSGVKGAKGDKGDTGNQGLTGATGPTPDITMSATADNQVGTPEVEVVKDGSETHPNFTFNFKNIKGETGDQGPQGAQGIQGPSGVYSGLSDTSLKDKGLADYTIPLSSLYPSEPAPEVGNIVVFRTIENSYVGVVNDKSTYIGEIKDVQDASVVVTAKAYLNDTGTHGELPSAGTGYAGRGLFVNASGNWEMTPKIYIGVDGPPSTFGPDYSTAFGSTLYASSHAYGVRSVSMGYNAMIRGNEDAVAIGYKSIGNSDRSVAIGANTEVDSDDSIAIGSNIQIGEGAVRSIIIGSALDGIAPDQIKIGSTIASDVRIGKYDLADLLSRIEALEAKS